MTKTMNNPLMAVSIVSALALFSYVLYYNIDRIGKTVEGFLNESGCAADNQILSDITEEEIDETDGEQVTDGAQVTDDVLVTCAPDNKEEVERLPEHGHDRFVRKTGVYPLLRTLSNKLDTKCPEMPEMPDMSKYILKSKVKPDKKCPDLSNYILKTNILPEKKCPDCVCPKVNVSAGLCKKCEPCPECPPPKRCPRPSCPKPKPCPEVRCPKTKPCPPQAKCPSPKPCKPCIKPKCSGCPYCQERSDGLLYHPKYPGSKEFDALRANNGQCDGEPDIRTLSKFKNLF